MSKKRYFKKIPKARKGAWFVKVRGSYLPASWQGWLSYIPFIGFLVVTSMVAFNNFSTGEALYRVFSVWITSAVVMTWFASRKS